MRENWLEEAKMPAKSASEFPKGETLRQALNMKNIRTGEQVLIGEKIEKADEKTTYQPPERFFGALNQVRYRPYNGY